MSTPGHVIDLPDLLKTDKMKRSSFICIIPVAPKSKEERLQFISFEQIRKINYMTRCRQQLWPGAINIYKPAILVILNQQVLYLQTGWISDQCRQCHSPRVPEWNSCICTHASCLKFLKVELRFVETLRNQLKNNQHLILIKWVQGNVPVTLRKYW